MNDALYVLSFNEAVYVPKNKNNKQHYIKIAVWVIVGIIIIASFIFKDNMFKQLSWTARVLLISLCIGTFFIGGTEKVPSAIEIQFYNDYLIVYRNKHYYSKRVTRREYDKFNYNDIKQIQIRTVTKRINIYGIVEGTWYNYKKDGTLPIEPTYHKTTDSICYFYIDFAENIDFASIFESYCPNKVIIEDN